MSDDNAALAIALSAIRQRSGTNATFSARQVAEEMGRTTEDDARAVAQALDHSPLAAPKTDGAALLPDGLWGFAD